MTRMLCAISMLLFLTPVSAWAQTYGPGFVWDRSADFTPGTVHLSSLGNPNLDSEGSVVWEMSWVGYGGRLGEVDPWYENTRTLSVHDSNWFSTGNTAWAEGNDSGGFIGADGMQQGLNGGAGGFIPLVRWVNPVTSPTELNIEGTLQVEWDGLSFAPNTDVDVAIVHLDSIGNYTPLYTLTFVKPTPGTSKELSAPAAVSLLGVQIDPGDSILISLQTRTQGLTADWIDFYDDLTLQIPTQVPASTPLGTWVLASLVLLAGFAAARSAATR